MIAITPTTIENKTALQGTLSDWEELIIILRENREDILANHIRKSLRASTSSRTILITFDRDQATAVYRAVGLSG